MKLVERLKRVTPKQWAIVGAGGGAAALLVNYLYARDSSVVSKLWRTVSGHGLGRSPSYPAPMPSELPSSAVLVEAMPPEVWAPMYGGVPHFAHHYSPHGGGHHHRTGIHSPDGVKSNVPPPGAYGVVSVTPPASTDPGQERQAPCGAGLYYDAAMQRCVPYPETTPPYGG